ncbi:hypothetical protein FA13DRAFT_1740687 [Coprinellus micaceus]|uniref:IgA peptidase M64-domain-containing protein n=1 Tax=Coprinellus micaceus TaxID=71717 RepID=A0A4Y7SLJ4_COPMI|nr:hypothetical protein FA13DRAFT_1740687 [Coprinellus micaceus]
MILRRCLIASLLQLSVLATTTGAEGRRSNRLGEKTAYCRSCDWDDEFRGERRLPWSSDSQRPFSSQAQAPALEVIPLGVSGSADNRVDLVFFSDGYLASERAKFIEDATRLAEDVSGNQTFHAVKPLLNFWGAFTPSNESGIGTGGVPKDTVYGLYRPGTELRAVYYSKPEVARAACASMGSQCDYPILLANDPFYGGVGGEFTTVTSSYLNGPLVLRHELGHSIVGVGEEYDGGFAYCGANAALEPLDIPWKRWLPSSHTPRIERSIMPFQSYPWTMLNMSSSWTAEFTSSGIYSRYLVKFSLSGIPSKSSFTVTLGGEDLGWEPERRVGLDRWHYDIHRADGLKPGVHKLNFALTDPALEGKAQLCSVEVLEFGDESEFNSTPGHYSLYPTFSMDNQTSYRPTNEGCLMRAVTKPSFCNACMEALWLSLLKRVHLIEGVTERCTPQNNTALSLSLVPLAHLRQTFPNAIDHHTPKLAEELKNESYTIIWKKGGDQLGEYTNMTTAILDQVNAAGTYTVEVKFATDAVRLTDDSALMDRLEYSVSSPCPR